MIFKLLVFSVLFFSVTGLSADNDSGFSVRKSDHFIVKYKVDNGFVDDLIKKAEEYYNSIEKDLGLSRFSNFWTWQNRCVIIIYGSQDEYHEKSGMPKWSGGCVDYSTKVMRTFPWSDKFVDVLLPHELTHIIFREYVKGNDKISLWLDEGIAQYQERKNVSETEKLSSKFFQDNGYIPLEEFNRIYFIGDSQNTEFVRIFYFQAESIVRFMINNYGKKRFSHFVRHLKDGKTVENALKFSYPMDIDSLDNLEKKWLEYIK